MADIEITSIHRNPSGPDTADKLNNEYIGIKNKSDNSYNIVSWIVSDRTPTGQETHLFHFPELTDELHKWTLDPGEYIFLFTGKGSSKFIQSDGKNPPQFHFFMNHGWFVWNNTGDTAYLRTPNGEFFHCMTVP